MSVRWELAKRNDFCSGGKELEKAKVCLCELLRSSESSLASFCQLRVTIQVGTAAMITIQPLSLDKFLIFLPLCFCYEQTYSKKVESSLSKGD